MGQRTLPEGVNYIDFLLGELGDPITNMGTYLGGMQKGISDKLFFLNHIHPAVIVDFGSADGSVVAEIHQRKPNIKLIGYDISPDMLELSKQKHPGITFIEKWDEVVAEVRNKPNTCLLLSSVLHEVYSYSDTEGVEQFWKNIMSAGFEYIVVRDTIPSRDIEEVAHDRFKQDVEIVRDVVTKQGNEELIQDYENRWGSLDKSYKNFVRFVLMYRYRDNWSRERLEDYLPISYEQLLDLFLGEWENHYRIIYDKQFKFKPIQRSFDRDFGVSLRKDLHLKLILRKR